MGGLHEHCRDVAGGPAGGRARTVIAVWDDLAGLDAAHKLLPQPYATDMPADELRMAAAATETPT